MSKTIDFKTPLPKTAEAWIQTPKVEEGTPSLRPPPSLRPGNP